MIMEGMYSASAKQLAMRDTVKLYLGSNVSPYLVIDSAKSLIDSVTYSGTFEFNNAPTGQYYLVTKHRNTIETWSRPSGEILVNNGSTYGYNFTSSASQAFGNNMTQVDVSPSRFGVYSGDVNQDGAVEGSDLSRIDNDAFNFITGYVATDLTGDNVVDAIDAAICDNNAFNLVVVSRP